MRRLRAKEIGCRIQQINGNGVSLLIYITSRAGQNLLDEIYGPTGWQRHHREIDGNLYCSIAVWDAEKSTWVEKEDVGTESYTEKAKGKASDSFKRACVNWGIGRELYSAPYIWIPKDSVHIKEKDGKYSTYDKFFVKSITYNDLGEINQLEIMNQNKETVYKKYGNARITEVQLKTLRDSIEKSEVDVKEIYDMCSIKSLEKMEVDDYAVVYRKLQKTIQMREGGVNAGNG